MKSRFEFIARMQWSLERLTWIQATGLAILLTAVIEGFCILFRFGFGLDATRDTCFLAPYTFGFRLHHGFIGVLLVMMMLPARNAGWKWVLFIAGLGLVLSDAVHHFAILPVFTGSTHFDLTYAAMPKTGMF